ncbi:MAG: universal stress protein [Acidimicrobiia bacterium]
MRILLGTDGSETARAAVQFIAGFPFPAAKSVHIVSVIRDVLREQEIESLTPEQWDAFEATKAGTHDEVAEVMEAGAETLRAEGWTVSTEIRTGHPADELIEAAEEQDSHLIVVGSHGLTGFRRFLLGSVSNQVLQSAKRSVLIVRKPEAECEGETRAQAPSADHPPRLLVGYDGSPHSEAAIDFCTELDLSTNGAIHLVTVLPMVRVFRQDIRQEMNWIWQQKRESEKETLESTAAQLRAITPNVTTELTEAGDVSDAILTSADVFDADLIILGHKGKGAVERFLMGSVTPRIAHHSCRSVLAIR